jgi:hypothetical protein
MAAKRESMVARRTVRLAAKLGVAGMTDFDQAMLETLISDTVGKPCAGCGGESQGFGIGEPNPRGLRELFPPHVAPGSRVVYPICGRCQKKGARSQAWVSAFQVKLAARLKSQGEIG